MTDPHPLDAHGRSHGKPSSWAAVTVAIAAFATGGAVLILGMWLAVYICAGVFVLSMLAGFAVGIMEDTVQWVVPEAGRRPEQLGEGEQGPRAVRDGS